MFTLALISLFLNFDTIQLGAGTMAEASLAARIVNAVCIVLLLAPVALVGLAVLVVGVLISMAGLVPLVVDAPAGRLRWGWKKIGRLSEISHLFCCTEEAGATYYVVFKDGTPPWSVPAYWTQTETGAGVQKLAEILGVRLEIGDKMSKSSNCF